MWREHLICASGRSTCLPGRWPLTERSWSMILSTSSVVGTSARYSADRPEDEEEVMEVRWRMKWIEKK